MWHKWIQSIFIDKKFYVEGGGGAAPVKKKKVAVAWLVCTVRFPPFPTVLPL